MNKEELIAKIEERLEVYHWREDLLSAYVKESLEDILDLARNLEEPKEVRKQLVPKGVADMLDDWNEFGVDSHSIMVTYHDWYYTFDNGDDDNPNVAWALANPTAYMKAWVNGYEVEDELYHVILSEDTGGWNYTYLDEDGSADFCNKKSNIQKFTKQEIMKIDERFWAFAVPVEGEDNGNE